MGADGEQAVLLLTHEERRALRLRLGFDIAHAGVQLGMLIAPGHETDVDTLSDACLEIAHAVGVLGVIGPSHTADEDPRALPLDSGLLRFVGSFAHQLAVGNVGDDERALWRGLAVRAHTAGANLTDVAIDFEEHE